MRGRIALVLAVVAISGCGDSDNSGDAQDGPTATVMCPAASMEPENPFDAKTLIGLTVAEAMDRARPHGCSVRVTERDGKPLIATMDLRHDRIDVTVVDGRVTAVAIS